MILQQIREEYSRIIKLGKFQQVSDYVNEKGYHPLSENLNTEQLEDLLKFCKTVN